MSETKNVYNSNHISLIPPQRRGPRPASITRCIASASSVPAGVRKRSGSNVSALGKAVSSLAISRV